MPPLNECLRWLLVAAMVTFLVQLWRHPRMNLAFAAYTALLIWQGLWMQPPSNRDWWIAHWMPLEIVTMGVLTCAVFEALFWAWVDDTPGLKISLSSFAGGIAGWFAMASTPSKLKLTEDYFDIFVYTRDATHAAAFAYLLVWMLYLSLHGKPVRDLWSRSHGWLLMLLMGAHVFSRPLGRYAFVPTHLIFAPIAIVAFCAWSVIVTILGRQRGPSAHTAVPLIQ